MQKTIIKDNDIKIIEDKVSLIGDLFDELVILIRDIEALDLTISTGDYKAKIHIESEGRVQRTINIDNSRKALFFDYVKKDSERKIEGIIEQFKKYNIV